MTDFANLAHCNRVREEGLGPRRGTNRVEEPPTPLEAEEIAARWSPNRTLASFYLWAAAGGALVEAEAGD